MAVAVNPVSALVLIRVTIGVQASLECLMTLFAFSQQELSVLQLTPEISEDLLA